MLVLALFATHFVPHKFHDEQHTSNSDAENERNIITSISTTAAFFQLIEDGEPISTLCLFITRSSWPRSLRALDIHTWKYGERKHKIPDCLLYFQFVSLRYSLPRLLKPSSMILNSIVISNIFNSLCNIKWFPAAYRFCIDMCVSVSRFWPFLVFRVFV